MLLHAWSQSTQRLGSLRPLSIKIIAYSPPTRCRSGIYLSCQLRNLASKSRKPLPMRPKAVAYESPAGKLAASPGPVLLYQATNTLPFTLGCYSIGVLLVMCAYINNATKRASVTADVPSWVKVGTALGQCAMIAYGGYMLMKVVCSLERDLLFHIDLFSSPTIS